MFLLLFFSRRWMQWKRLCTQVDSYLSTLVTILLPLQLLLNHHNHHLVLTFDQFLVSISYHVMSREDCKGILEEECTTNHEKDGHFGEE